MAVDNKNKFLNYEGLSQVWNKITDLYVRKVEGKDLSDENYTAGEKSKLAGIEAGAQVNVIEGVAIAAVGATSATPTEKSGKTAVIRVSTDISKATTTDPLTMASDIAVKTYVDNKVSDKNVGATGDSLVSATAANNVVTVKATSDLTSAVTKANSAIQGVTGDKYVVATKSGANVTLATAVGATGDKLITAATVISKISDQAAIDADNLAKGMTATYNAATSYTDDTLETLGLTKALGSAAFTETSAYATAAQGTKADNALQSVTGSTYVTVSAKSGNSQTISVNTKTVASNTAGLADAKDVKSYVDTKIADVTALVTASTQFLGVSTTAIADGATTPTTVNGKTVGAGDIAMYGTSEFIWDGSKWVLLGDTTAEAAAINVLEGRMDTAEDDIDALEGRMTTAEGDINTANDAIDALEGRMDTAEDDIDALEGRMTTVEGVAATAVQSGSGDNYITVGKTGTKLTVAADVCTNIANATDAATQLADASAVKTYVDNQITDKINALDGSESTVATPAPVLKVATSVTQTNGVVSTVYTEFTAISSTEITAICV